RPSAGTRVASREGAFREQRRGLPRRRVWPKGICPSRSSSWDHRVRPGLGQRAAGLVEIRTDLDRSPADGRDLEAEPPSAGCGILDHVLRGDFRIVVSADADDRAQHVVGGNLLELLALKVDDEALASV